MAGNNGAQQPNQFPQNNQGSNFTTNNHAHQADGVQGHPNPTAFHNSNHGYPLRIRHGYQVFGGGQQGANFVKQESQAGGFYDQPLAHPVQIILLQTPYGYRPVEGSQPGSHNATSESHNPPPAATENATEQAAAIVSSSERVADNKDDDPIKREKPNESAEDTADYVGRAEDEGSKIRRARCVAMLETRLQGMRAGLESTMHNFTANDDGNLNSDDLTLAISIMKDIEEITGNMAGIIRRAGKFQ